MDPKTPASKNNRHLLRQRSMDTQPHRSKNLQAIDSLAGPEKENKWPENDVKQKLDLNSTKIRNDDSSPVVLPVYEARHGNDESYRIDSMNQESDVLSLMMSRYCSPDDKSNWEGFHLPSPIIFDLVDDVTSEECEVMNLTPECFPSSHVFDDLQSNKLIQTPVNSRKRSPRIQSTFLSHVLSESKIQSVRPDDTLNLSISSMGSEDWNLEILNEQSGPPPNSDIKGVTAFKTFRSNSTNIALHESQVYLDKIKDLEYRLLLSEERVKREAEFRTDFEQRNKILLTEVRFADQTCLEECNKSKNLQSELDRILAENDELKAKLKDDTTSLTSIKHHSELDRIRDANDELKAKLNDTTTSLSSTNLQSELDRLRSENDELKAKLKDATTSLTQCQMQLETQKLPKPSNGIQVKSITALGIQVKPITAFGIKPKDQNNVATSCADANKMWSRAYVGEVRDTRSSDKNCRLMKTEIDQNLPTFGASNDVCPSNQEDDLMPRQILPNKKQLDDASLAENYLRDIEKLKTDLIVKENGFNLCLSSLQSFRGERTKAIDAFIKEMPVFASIEVEKEFEEAMSSEAIYGYDNCSQTEVLFFAELSQLRKISMRLEYMMGKANRTLAVSDTTINQPHEKMGVQSIQGKGCDQTSELARPADLQAASSESSKFYQQESELLVGARLELHQELQDANEKLDILRDEFIEMKESLEEKILQLTGELRLKTDDGTLVPVKPIAENAPLSFEEKENDDDKEWESKLLSSTVAHLTTELEATRCAMKSLVADYDNEKFKVVSNCQLLERACKETCHDLGARVEMQFKSIGSRVDRLVRSISILKSAIEVDLQSGCSSKRTSQICHAGDVKVDHHDSDLDIVERKEHSAFLDSSTMSRDAIPTVVRYSVSEQKTIDLSEVGSCSSHRKSDAILDSISILSQSLSHSIDHHTEDVDKSTSFAQHIKWLVASPVPCFSNNDYGKVDTNITPIAFQDESVSSVEDNGSERGLPVNPVMSPGNIEISSSNPLTHNSVSDKKLANYPEDKLREREIQQLRQFIQALIRGKESQELLTMKDKMNENERKLSVSELERQQCNIKLLGLEQEYAALERSYSDAMDMMSVLQEQARRLTSELSESKSADIKLDSLTQEIRLVAATVNASMIRSSSTNNEASIAKKAFEEEIQKLQSENTELSNKCDRLRAYVKKLASKCDEWRCFQTSIMAKYKKTREKVNMLCLYHEHKDQVNECKTTLFLIIVE